MTFSHIVEQPSGSSVVDGKSVRPGTIGRGFESHKDYISQSYTFSIRKDRNPCYATDLVLTTLLVAMILKWIKSYEFNKLI